MSSYTFKGGKYAGRTLESIADRGFIQWVATNHSAPVARNEAVALLLSRTAPVSAVVVAHAVVAAASVARPYMTAAEQAVYVQPAACRCGGAGLCAWCAEVLDAHFPHR